MGSRSQDEPAPSPAIKAVGKTLAAKYLLARLVGEGGMGAVYEAEHLEIGKRVAIKIVRALRGQETESAARFIREARAASAVESDHIVQVFDVGQDPELGLYMVMELLAGEDLGSVIARAGRLDAPVACAIADQAASALDRAHAAGVIHRDLKPENVFLKGGDDGSAIVKLVDFGVAKVVREARTEKGAGGNITRMGSVLGSPCYMSPEQAQGLPEVDHRSDIYALGAVLYEMLTGKRAFAEKATYEQTIVPIITQTAPRVSATLKTVGPALDQLVADLMNSKPDLRPQTMRDVRRRLAKIQPGVDETRIRLKLVPRSQDASRGPRTHASVVTDMGDAATLARPPSSTLARPPRALVMGGAMLFGGALAVLVFTWGIAGRKSARPRLAVGASSTPPAAIFPPAPTAAVTASPDLAPEPTAAASAVPTVSPAPSKDGAGAPSAVPSAAPAAPSASASTTAPPRAKQPPRSTAPNGQVGGVGITNDF